MKYKTLHWTSARIGFLLLILLSICACIYFFLFRGDETSLAVMHGERLIMGTNWSLQVVCRRDQSSELASQAMDEAFSELFRIDEMMSEWKEESPISQVNSAAGEQLVTVPLELTEMIKRGIEYGKLTQGVFDITWRGMGKLWHFDEEFVVPTEDQIQKAIARVDYRKILIEGEKVGLKEKEMAIGLGGVAKGYAVDRAAAVLNRYSFSGYLVNGGGDIKAAGERGDRPWRVGIQDPRGERNELIARVDVRDLAVVTSGDYERFQIVDGIRYHHIIDPRTGRPASACQSITVVAASAEEADVLATAGFILGPKEGLALIKMRPGVEAFFVDSAGEYWMSENFRNLAEFF